MKFFTSKESNAKWQHGRVSIIIAHDFKANKDCQYWYLKRTFPNAIYLHDVIETLFMDGVSPFEREKYSLQHLNENDKLIIVGHSNERGYEDMPIYRLVKILKLLKLQRVGVIKLHSCLIAKGDWMLRFGNALISSGISFSYLSGPRGIYWYMPTRYARDYCILAGNIKKSFNRTRYTPDNVDGYVKN